MTREEILNMPAGREMDALIAENVMCIEPITFNDETKCPECESTMRFCGSRSWCSSCHEWMYSPYKEYSTDISAALDMVEHLREKLGTCKFYFIVDPKQGDNVRAVFDPILDDEHFEASADTIPLAICRAALLAVTK